MTSSNPPLNIGSPLRPSILTIPKEILHDILDLVTVHPHPGALDEIPFVEYQLNGEERKLSQILVLRSVCRDFRAITAELDFWYHYDFVFARLLSFPEEDPLNVSWRQSQEEELIEVLLIDTNLANSLGRRKTEWTLESLRALSAVMEGVPLFKQNARAIHVWIDDGLGWCDTPGAEYAINMLAVCCNITTFSTHLTCNINLNAIAPSLPFLENLSVSTDYFEGSLQEFNGLQALHMECLDEIYWSEDRYEDDVELPREFRPWLPLKSTETLTKLNLNCGRHVGISFFDLPSLDKFVNLKSLGLGPLDPDICDFLLGAQFQLDVFEPSIIPYRLHIDKFISMLQAPCLRTVTEFGLSNFHHGWRESYGTRNKQRTLERYYSLALDGFTSLLPSLEQVRLDVPLHVECCAYFARLTKLKSLNWDGSSYPVFGCGMTSAGDPKVEKDKVEVEKALERAFEGVMEKPVLHITPPSDEI